MNDKSKYIDKLSTLSSEELLTILHDCVNLLSPVSPADMAIFDNISKKQVLNRIELNKYLTFNFDGRKYPIINHHFKGSS